MDLSSGAELFSLKLPPGFLDRLAFESQDRLLLVRQETTDLRSLPNGANPDSQKSHRSCRVRNLLSDEPLKLLLELKDFPEGALQVRLAPSGKWVVVEGLEMHGQNRKRVSKLFETLTGRQCWVHPSEYKYDTWRTGPFDPTGRFLTLGSDSSLGKDLIDVESGKRIRTFDEHTLRISFDEEHWIRWWIDSQRGGVTNASLFRAADESRLLTLTGPETDSESLSFSSDSTRIVWGNSDGTVVVFDTNIVRRQLAKLGLDW